MIEGIFIGMCFAIITLSAALQLVEAFGPVYEDWRELHRAKKAVVKEAEALLKKGTKA